PISVGPRNGVKMDGGRVKHVEFHPTDANTYYVSTFKGGLFRTTDAGTNWTPLTDQLVEDVYISQVDPTDANTIYIGTNLGVLKSTDGGSSWGATGLTTSNTNALLIKPDAPSVVVVGNDSGIYLSLDGGANFSMVQSAVRVEELRVHPTNPDIMYAGTDGSPSQFFRSVDGGQTWTENTTDFGQGTFMKIAVSPASPNVVYVINSRDHMGEDSYEGVYRSTDSGATFTRRSGGVPCITGYSDTGAISRGQPNYNLFIVSDPTDSDIIYAGGVKSWRSTDGGQTWVQFFNNVTADGGALHLDQLTWAYSPHTNVLFAANDGGIYHLNGNGQFQQITDGLPIAEVFACAQSQTNPEVVAGGTMHCGIKLNRGGDWFSPWGGDEATVIFDYTNDTYAYHFKNQRIHRSSDGGMSFQRINPLTADSGEYRGTGVLDKSDVNTLFVGLLEVERINNARTATSSTVWDKISSFGGGDKIKKIEQSDADHNIMYVSRGNGSFYRSDNVRGANPIWTNLTGSLPSSGNVADIATHPTNANIVYLLQGSKIYKSSNKGGSWSDISTGLPGVALLEMVYDRTSNEGIYVGTDLGVYYKDANLNSW
ncbi:VPS10 domain-containing protein, partial [Snuella lapsa]|uniref:VPS10 domain-containing protein n=1 Tax=Snuella lapsa TaxID=870481 RepID=UPI0031EEA609